MNTFNEYIFSNLVRNNLENDAIEYITKLQLDYDTIYTIITLCIIFDCYNIVIYMLNQYGLNINEKIKICEDYIFCYTNKEILNLYFEYCTKLHINICEKFKDKNIYNYYNIFLRKNKLNNLYKNEQ